LVEEFLHNLYRKEKDTTQYSPLVLAYIGDTVFELYIKTMLVCKGNASVNNLHLRSVHYVSAKSQSGIIHRILPKLTDEEKDIVRRGRNAKSGTVPKNADISEYKYATGFESLIGYLYLEGRFERLTHIINMAIEEHGDGKNC
jgi:ribonuclease III family protein